jgi:hypothetical protein
MNYFSAALKALCRLTEDGIFGSTAPIGVVYLRFNIESAKIQVPMLFNDDLFKQLSGSD